MAPPYSRTRTARRPRCIRSSERHRIRRTRRNIQSIPLTWGASLQGREAPVFFAPASVPRADARPPTPHGPPHQGSRIEPNGTPRKPCGARGHGRRARSRPRSPTPFLAETPGIFQGRAHGHGSPGPAPDIATPRTARPARTTTARLSRPIFPQRPSQGFLGAPPTATGQEARTCPPSSDTQAVTSVTPGTKTRSLASADAKDRADGSLAACPVSPDGTSLGPTPCRDQDRGRRGAGICRPRSPAARRPTAEEVRSEM